MQRVTNVRRRATALIYATIAFIAVIAFVALGVDWGRVQLTKTELRNAAVAGARYAAAGLQNDLNGFSAASANAAAVAVQNKANGQPISFNQQQDVEIGIWDRSARTFTLTSNLNQANAVHVTMRCAAARGTSVALPFLSILKFGRTADIASDSIAMVSYAGTTSAAGNGRFEYFVPATDNPWLSGEPKGTVASVNNPHKNQDKAGDPMSDDGQTKMNSFGRGFTSGGSTDPDSADDNYEQWGDYSKKKASPIEAGGISVAGGVPMTFDGVNGGATNSAGQSTVDADGGGIVSNSAGAENGIANVSAPINSIIGVFLDDKVPDTTAAPAALDFSSSASRDYLTLKPLLKQPFFIGDGRTSSGEVQQVVPPAGATRLFICTMDAYEWSNNLGGFFVTAHVKGRIITVK